MVSTLKALAELPRGPVVDNSCRFSGDDVFRMSLAFQRGLEGLKLSGTVGVTAQTSVELIALLTALIRMQLSVLLLPKTVSEKTAGKTLAQLGYPALISDSLRYRPCFPNNYSAALPIELGAESIRRFLVFLSSVHPNSKRDSRNKMNASVFKLTSGTSQESRIVSLTESQLMNEATAVSKTLEITEDDGVFVPVSILHSYGFDLGFLMWLLTGTPLFLSRFDQSTLEAFLATRATVFLGLPRMYELLLRSKRQLQSASHIRFMLSCTSYLSPDTIERFGERFNILLCQHYGTSETGALTNQVPSQILRKITSVGRPMHGVKLSLIDEFGSKTRGPGYVVARGPAISSGYLLEPRTRGNTPGFIPGGFITADIGTLDNDGFLHLQPDSRRVTARQVLKEQLISS